MSNPDAIVSPDDDTENGAATPPDRPRKDGLPRDPDATEHLDVDITGAGE